MSRTALSTINGPQSSVLNLIILMQRVSRYPMHRPSQLTNYVCFKLLLGFQDPYRRPFRASINLAPRAGFEPATKRLTVFCATAAPPRNKLVFKERTSNYLLVKFQYLFLAISIKSNCAVAVYFTLCFLIACFNLTLTLCAVCFRTFVLSANNSTC